MTKIKKTFFIGFILTAGISVSAQTIRFADDLANWKQLRSGSEKNDGFLRVSVEPNARGNFGQLYKFLPAIPEGKYLQIKVRAMENAGSFAWVSSISTGFRRTFGILFQGINTFSPRAENRFIFSINQLGAYKKQGAWINYDSYEISEAPENSLTAVKEPAEGALKVGDTLKFKIFRKQPCAEPVKIRIFTTAQSSRNLQDFKLCRDNFIETVYNEAEKCYTASLKVTKDAYSVDTEQDKVYIIAVAKLGNTDSYFTMPFPVKLETGRQIPAAVFSADSPETKENRQAWFNLISGRKNLALRKPVKFVPQPLYPLTKDKKGEAGSDAYDLTDGSISKGSSDKIWFDRRAVGFFAMDKNDSNTVFMRLDLGKVCPVDYIALRALGGGKTMFRWPRKFEVFVSKDGTKFFQAAEMTKLEPAESNQSDFIRTYYYPEDRSWGDSVCKSFKLHVKADARYIIVKLTLDLNFFSDEMAVIAAEKKDGDFNRAYEGKGFAMPNDGLTASPRVPELAVIKGVAAPQTFMISDYRNEPSAIKKAQVILELPEPLTVYKAAAEKITINGKKYNRFRLPIGKHLRFGRIYILSQPDIPDQLPPANIYVEYDGQTGFKQTLPMKIVSLPEFKTFRNLPVCLAWMVTETLMDEYPDLLKNYMRFGFNAAGVFPRYWSPENVVPKIIGRCDEMRKAGLKVFMNESPIHVMVSRQLAGPEIFCITGKSDRLICPSYTGKFYRKEMDRIARCVTLSKPDHVLLDIECFNDAFRRSAKECSRCAEAIKKSGKSEAEYLYSCGKRMLSDIAVALERGAAAANIPVPAMHMYALDNERSVHGICRFSDVYPKIIKSAQPSLYVGGHPEVIQKTIRNNRKLLGNRDIMPWLSTGCYGEYDSRWVEPIVLEALMNGAGGILNYCFDFFTDSPLDFYYHALAIMKLAPYEDLLTDGEYPEIKGSNPKMFYSAVRKGNRMLLLVGNYYKSVPATSVMLPFSKAKVLDLNTRKSFSVKKEFKFDVEPGGFSLFYITGF